MTDSAGFSNYATYADLITAITEQFCNGENSDPTEAKRHLATAASDHLRDMVSLSSRRLAGTFFTPPSLASRALRPHAEDILRGLTVLDPACGAGDLLLAAASVTQPLGGDRARLYRQLHGADIVPELSATALARLGLSAALESVSATSTIQTIDGIEATRKLDIKKLLVLNPPYGQIDRGVTPWGSGRTTAAAHFLVDLISAASPGDEVCAILPEVLRSGARYGRWRSFIAQQTIIKDVEPVGLFDQHANVDVFILRLHIIGPSRSASGQWPIEESDQVTIGDLFSVSVGPVVPHRDFTSGADHPYLHSQNTPINSSLLNSTERTSHGGKTFDPPFVLIRRTSAPSPINNRFSVSCVTGIEPYSIENHLIVLRPNDGELESCMRLHRYLQDPAATEWMNARSRMRHLTVATIRQMPADLEGGHCLLQD